MSIPVSSKPRLAPPQPEKKSNTLTRRWRVDLTGGLAGSLREFMVDRISAEAG